MWRDKAIEFKPVKAAVDILFYGERKQTTHKEKSSHSKHHLFWLQGLAHPHRSLGGIHPTPPQPCGLLRGALIFCQYLPLPFLPLAARREGAFILQFGLIKFELS